jgi:hypothetical protein
LAIKVMELILLGYVSHFLTVFIKHFYFPWIYGVGRCLTVFSPCETYISSKPANPGFPYTLFSKYWTP